jgi:Insertion element 4 transposase N-terminal
MGGRGPEKIHIDLDAMTTAFPSRDVERILEDLGRREKRRRKLPSAVVVYHVIALGLMVSTGAKEVLRCLLDRVREREWVGGWPLASEAAITKAHARGLEWNRCASCSSNWRDRSRKRRAKGVGFGDDEW